MAWLRRLLVRWALRGLDLETFNKHLPRVQPGWGGYTTHDRHRDFRAVFFGASTPEQGMRVYSQIVDLCHGTGMGYEEIDSHARLAARAGGIRIGQTIEMWAQLAPVTLEERTE